MEKVDNTVVEELTLEEEALKAEQENNELIAQLEKQKEFESKVDDAKSKLKLVKFTLPTFRKIAGYLKQTGYSDVIKEIMFRKTGNFQRYSCAELRDKANLSVEELNSYKLRFGEENPDEAAKAISEDKGIDLAAESDELYVAVYDLVMEMLSDDDKYEPTIGIIAYLFSTTPDVIESLEFTVIVGLIMTLLNSPNFTGVLRSVNK